MVTCCRIHSARSLARVIMAAHPNWPNWKTTIPLRGLYVTGV
jgi:hypothetical protein